MNTKIIKLLLVISLGVNFYMYKQDKNKSLQIDSKDQIRVQQSAIKKTLKNNSEQIENLRGIKNAILEVDDSKYDQLKETKINQKEYLNEEEVEKAQEAWQRKATDFFVGSLELSQNEIDDYFQLDKKREAALSMFMQKRILDNGGDQFFYTLEDIVNENKINELYLNKLKSLLGTNGYSEYKKFRNAYNKQIIESGEGFFLIEI